MDLHHLLNRQSTLNPYNLSPTIPLYPNSNSNSNSNSNPKSFYSNSSYSPLSSETLNSSNYSPTEPTQSHSPLESTSPQFIPLSGSTFIPPQIDFNFDFYSHSHQNMHQRLQQIETALMAPDPFSEAEPDSRDVKRVRTETLKPASVSYLNPRSIKQDPPQTIKQDTQIMVKQMLVNCAKALNDMRIDEFRVLEQDVRKLVSITGEPVRRVGAYLLEGLVARYENSGTNIYRALKCKEPESNELLSYMRILYDICPYFKFGYMAANGAIAEAVRTENNIHIIDFQIAQGTQWVTLIQALAARPGGPPRVKITGIDDPVSEFARGDGLQSVGKMLQEMSVKFNIPLEFNGLSVYASQVSIDMLNVKKDEALVVNFSLLLHHTPDESVDLENLRDGLLRMVKSLNPKVTTIVEQESNTNTTPFLTRFVETLDYYSAMFESIDVTLPRDKRERINVEQHCLARDIVNIIACEGKERVERHELLGKWKLRLSMAGFKPYPLSGYVNSVIKKLLGCYSEKYTLVEREGALLLGWKNRNLISASAWH